ncbi:MAG: nucleotide exchange factor GrpE [Firmicutes bacterium]|nr:nucleotide exchange factor GrpE [Bacillota bacterium]
MTEEKQNPEQVEEQANSAEPEETGPCPQCQELEARYKRLAADLENFRKRSERVNREIVSRATEDLVCKLLPVLDNFRIALDRGKQDDPFFKGMEMIHQQLMDVLQAEGLQPLSAQGESFDPSFHEAVAFVDADADCPGNIVTEDLRLGYKLGDKLIRPCMVKVSKQKEEQDDE